MWKTMLASLAVLAPVAALASDVQMTPGLWEMSASMDVPGMPFKLPPQTFQHCYTKEDVAKMDSGVPTQEGDCRVAESKRIGNKLTWKLVCAGKRPGKGEGEIVFKSATAYEGWMKYESSGQVMTTKYSATRLGDCK